MIHYYPTLWYGTLRPEMPVRRYLLATSSWARFRRRDGSIRPASLPQHIRDCAIDPGAYAAAHGGGYSFTFSEYAQWLSGFRSGQVEWAGTMDFYCLTPVPLKSQRRRPPPAWIRAASGGNFVREQQIKTSVNAHETFWSYRDAPFAWVPTLQGITVSDYVRHAHEMRPLIAEMQAYYGSKSAFRVGIGSLCRPMPKGKLHEIIASFAAALPEGTQFHLWGVKLRAFQLMRTVLPDCVISCDSAMWNGGQKRTGGHGSAKDWKASGKTQMDFAYDHLPKYEQEIQRALARTHQLEFPMASEHAVLYAEPETPRIEAHRQFLETLRDAERGVDELPYPYGLHHAHEAFDDDEWFTS